MSSGLFCELEEFRGLRLANIVSSWRRKIIGSIFTEYKLKPFFCKNRFIKLGKCLKNSGEIPDSA